MKNEDIEFFISVFGSEPGKWKQIKSQDMNKINVFMENKKNYPENAIFHLEVVSKGIIIAGERDNVGGWKSKENYWYMDECF